MEGDLSSARSETHPSRPGTGASVEILKIGNFFKIYSGVYIFSKNHILPTFQNDIFSPKKVPYRLGENISCSPPSDFVIILLPIDFLSPIRFCYNSLIFYLFLPPFSLFSPFPTFISPFIIFSLQFRKKYIRACLLQAEA